MTKKKNFEEDMNLIWAFDSVGDLWERSDKVRVTKLLATPVADALRSAMKARHDAYRVWVKHYGTKTEKRDIAEADEAEEYFARLNEKASSKAA